MKQAGKAHWLIVAGIASLLVVLGLFFFGKDNAALTASEFMKALGKGDVDKLVALSYYEGGDRQTLREKWDFAVHRAGPHYIFAWRIAGIQKSDPENAAAVLMVTRNADQGGYEEKFQLPLVQKGGDWKVDVRAINRLLYPALPR